MNIRLRMMGIGLCISVIGMAKGNMVPAKLKLTSAQPADKPGSVPADKPAEVPADQSEVATLVTKKVPEDKPENEQVPNKLMSRKEFESRPENQMVQYQSLGNSGNLSMRQWLSDYFNQAVEMIKASDKDGLNGVLSTKVGTISIGDHLKNIKNASAYLLFFVRENERKQEDMRKLIKGFVRQ